MNCVCPIAEPAPLPVQRPGLRHIPRFKDAQVPRSAAFRKPRPPRPSVIGRVRCGRHDGDIPASLTVKAFPSPKRPE